jgi:Fe-S-cluster containining protein
MADALSPLDAGDFATWLTNTHAALRGERDAQVPCGGCTACCTSSMFIHIEPDEVDTLRRIPREMLVPAPLRPRGHMVLGHDERGHCPMLIDGACSIYEDRPRTCRTYDCRIFAAAGIDVAESDDTKTAIADRAQRWRFTYGTSRDVVEHEAIRERAGALHRTEPDIAAVEVAIRAITQPASK